MKVAGAQPKSTRAATAKTKPSETPFASAPSTGTGKRSASVEATRNAATPAIVVARPWVAEERDRRREIRRDADHGDRRDDREQSRGG